MTAEISTSERRYRPALRGLVFGLIGLALRAATVGVVVWVASMPGTSGGVERALQVLVLANLLAAIVGLIGVGYCAIASHRRERGPVLVLAWVASVLAALFDIEPFLYYG